MAPPRHPSGVFWTGNENRRAGILFGAPVSLFLHVLTIDKVPANASVIFAVAAFMPGLVLAPTAEIPVLMAKAAMAGELTAMILASETAGIIPFLYEIMTPANLQAAIAGAANQRQDGFEQVLAPDLAHGREIVLRGRGVVLVFPLSTVMRHAGQGGENQNGGGQGEQDLLSHGMFLSLLHRTMKAFCHGDAEPNLRARFICRSTSGTTPRGGTLS
jgi:hypothetical protein